VPKNCTFFKDNPLIRFDAKKIADGIVSKFPEDYSEKWNNPDLKIMGGCGRTPKSVRSELS